MNAVRERVLIGITPYLEFPEHKDLISFCIDSELFEDWDEVEENEFRHEAPEESLGAGIPKVLGKECLDDILESNHRIMQFIVGRLCPKRK